MKKFIFSLLIIMAIICFNKDKVVIPNNSIRLRIIANSNEEVDQNLKYQVKEEINSILGDVIGNDSDINKVRSNINNNIDLLNSTVEKVLDNNNYTDGYSINYGLNYFPRKQYKSLVYEEGMYESLVITLGEGMGNNWWCVLFPPFCLVEAENSDEVTYTWKIKELIDKYF